jgi:hypothetical protein
MPQADAIKPWITKTNINAKNENDGVVAQVRTSRREIEVGNPVETVAP